jgi:tRNA(adenine34) deaminase
MRGKTRVSAPPRERSDALAADGVGHDPISSRRRRDETENDTHPPGNPGDVGSCHDADKAMMARCVELSRIAVRKGEYPFGTVIARDGQILAEAVNRTIREGDVTRHAEVIALSLAQKTIGREQLRNCTLYSNIEPCAMCSYCVREAWVGRVVYALGSPVMGGLSKWDILRDDGMSRRMPEVFGAVPEVVSGVLLREAQQAWREWNPLAWEMIKLRGLLTAPSAQDNHVDVQPAHRLSLRHYFKILLMRIGQSRIESEAPMGAHDNL